MTRIGWIERILAHPWLVLLALFTLTAGLGAGAKNLRFNSSIETFFIQRDPARDAYERFRTKFGDDQVVIVAYEPSNGGVFDASNLVALQSLTRRLQGLAGRSGIERVVSVTNAFYADRSKGFAQASHFVPDVIPTDPAELDALRARALGEPLVKGGLISEDLSAAAVLIFFESTPQAFAAKGAALAEINRVARDAIGEAVGRVRVSGVPVVNEEITRGMVRDLKTYLPLCFVVGGIVMLILFKHWAGVVLPLLAVGMAIVCSFGFLGWTTGEILATTTVVPPLIVTLAVDHAIHFFVAFNEATGSRREKVQRAVSHVKLPMLLATVTTAIGFGTLVTSNIVMVRDFGLQTLFGISMGALLALSFPAAMASVIPISGLSHNPRVQRGFEVHANFVIRNARAILGVFVVVIAVGIFGITRLRIDTNWAENFRPDNPVRQTLHFFETKLAGVGGLVVVLKSPQGADSALTPEMALAADRIERVLKEIDEVDYTISLAGYFRHMNGIAADSQSFPSAATLTSQYRTLFERHPEVSRFISNDWKELAVIGWSKTVSSERTLAMEAFLLRRLAEELGPDVKYEITGSLLLVARTAKAMTWGMLSSLGSTSFVVFALMAFALRWGRLSVIAMFPNIPPVIIGLGLIGLTGIPLNAVNSVVACITLGMEVDNTFYFLKTYREHRAALSVEDAVRAAMGVVGRPALFTTMINCAGFMLLTLSSFVPVAQLGWLAASSLAIGVMADLTMLPALLVTFDRRD